MHGRAKGHDAPYEEYCLELVAALAGKFAHLPDDRLNYSYQLDSGLYARFLRQMAEADGTTRIEGRIARVALDGESGDIAARQPVGDRTSVVRGTSVSGRVELWGRRIIKKKKPN